MIPSFKTRSRSMSPIILNVFPTFAIGGSEVRFATLVNSPQHGFRLMVFAIDGAIDGRYDCFDLLKPNAGVKRSQLNFPVPELRRMSLPLTRRSAI